MMGIALGGIGVISLRVPFTMSNSFLHVLDLPSILLATFIVAVFGLIAYFTNPNEASFRAFLTELAFRQHLSRLSEAQEGDTDEYDDDSRSHNGTRLLDKNTRKHGTPQGSGPNHGHASASITDAPIVFHFANKASVSLRTPGYHFRSFAVLTFAIALPVEMAIAPVPVPNPAHAHAQPPKPISWSNPSTHGTWFVGAFGRWWFGLEMNMPPRQVRLTAQDDAALRERELVRSRGDDVESSSGSRHAEEVFSSHKASRLGIPRRTSSAAPPRTKAALRERLSLQTSSSNKRDANTHTHTPPRPTTPPPLPKSASLPLHAKRIPPPKTENNAHSLPLLPTPTVGDISPAFARTPSTHDQSPIITDILKQLDATRSATSELHTQLSEFQDASARAHAILQTEVDAARAMKKREDSGRAEIKTKTKILDDARRQADGSKREAEKKLKAATVARDGATGRIERLGREVEELRRRMADDSARVIESRAQADAERHEISETLASKREEIKVAEEVVVALTTRARDLEAEIAEETARLKKLKEEAEGRRQRHSAVSKTDKSSWPPPLLIPAQRSPSTRFTSHQVASTLGTDTVRPSADFSRPPLPPHSHPLNVGGISNHPPGTAQTNGDSGVTPADGQYVPQFRPFADPPVVPLSTPAYSGPVSPVSASLVPNSLAQSRESTRSGLPNSDVLFSRLPIVRPPPSEELSPIDEPQHLSHIDQFDSQRAVLPPRPRSPSFDDEPTMSKPPSRHWFSAAAKEKGLNPDAKEFTLPYGRPLALGMRSGASTPNAFGSEVFPSQSRVTESPPPRVGLAGSFFSSLHNPFAPSPAEREALQRALGSGSGNASLERVSSHGSGSGNGGSGGGGSHNTSPHWLSEPRREVATSTRRSFFNPWATEGK